jgi:hypothetical protein
MVIDMNWYVVAGMEKGNAHMDPDWPKVLALAAVLYRVLVLSTALRSYHPKVVRIEAPLGLT